jgi:hypothetical protein
MRGLYPWPCPGPLRLDQGLYPALKRSSSKTPAAIQNAFWSCLTFLPYTALANRGLPSISCALKIALSDLSRSTRPLCRHRVARSEVQDLLDVVNQAVEHPLNNEFDPSSALPAQSDGKPVSTLIGDSKLVHPVSQRICINAQNIGGSSRAVDLAVCHVQYAANVICDQLIQF